MSHIATVEVEFRDMDALAKACVKCGVELLKDLGNVSIRRASHVEPEGDGWSADMSPVGGPVLSGFSKRQEAIDAEIKWMKSNRGL